jgi:hypothetical protein
MRKGGFEPPRSCERQPLKLTAETDTPDQANIYGPDLVQSGSVKGARGDLICTFFAHHQPDVHSSHSLGNASANVGLITSP